MSLRLSFRRNWPSFLIYVITMSFILPDPIHLVQELRRLNAGIVDTSTLIYLEKIKLLNKVVKSFQLTCPVQVEREFGRCLTGMTVLFDCPGKTDQAVVALARQLGLPVLSEDKQILMECRGDKISHYNTLMILLALLCQDVIRAAEYEKAYKKLRQAARYSPGVWQVGEKVFCLFVR